MRLMSKGEYVIVPKGTKFTGSGKLGLMLLSLVISDISVALIRGTIVMMFTNFFSVWLKTQKYERKKNSHVNWLIHLWR